MKTNQIMKRDFDSNKISQRTSDSFFNGTELLAIYNNQNQVKKSFDDFWLNKGTQSFIKELENDLILNTHNSGYYKTHEATRGKGGGTWLHPYLFVKFAMWLSPKFELQVIKWVYDNLIDFRINAGDNYKSMCDAIKINYEKTQIGTLDPFVFVQEANFINQLVFNSAKPKQRNEASEYELRLLNYLQKMNIYYLEKSIAFQDRKKLLVESRNQFTFLNNGF